MQILFLKRQPQTKRQITKFVCALQEPAGQVSGSWAAVSLCIANASNLMLMKMKPSYIYIYNLEPVDDLLKNNPLSQL